MKVVYLFKYGCLGCLMFQKEWNSIEQYLQNRNIPTEKIEYSSEKGQSFYAPYMSFFPSVIIIPDDEEQHYSQARRGFPVYRGRWLHGLLVLKPQEESVLDFINFHIRNGITQDLSW